MAYEESFEDRLFIQKYTHLLELKKLHILNLEYVNRNFIIAVGAIMVFLCAEAANSFNSKTYPFLWLIPAVLSVYASRRIDKIIVHLSDIRAYEIENIESKFFSEDQKYEKSWQETQDRRSKKELFSFIKYKFWYGMAALNIALAAAQFIYGPLINIPPLTADPKIVQTQITKTSMAIVPADNGS